MIKHCPNLEAYLKNENVEKDIDNETHFKIIRPHGYYKLTNNIKRAGNLIYKPKQELKRGPRQTSQIAEPPHRGKTSLKFVMLGCAEEEKLRYRKES